MSDPIDPARVREAVENFRRQARNAREDDPRDTSWADQVDLLCTAALDALTQRDLVREQSEAMAELQREIAHRKAMQPEDRDGRPITQAPANRMMIAYYDDLPAARAEILQLRSELEAAQRTAKHYVEQVVYLSEEANKATEEKRTAQRELEAARAERERLRELLGSADCDADPAEPPECRRCGGGMHIPNGLEPTPECDLCAQVLLGEARAALSATPSRDVAQLKPTVPDQELRSLREEHSRFKRMAGLLPTELDDAIAATIEEIARAGGLGPRGHQLHATQALRRLVLDQLDALRAGREGKS